MKSSEENRRNERRKVDYTAHASNETVHVIGAHVLDVTKDGAFVQPLKSGQMPAAGQVLRMDVFTNGFKLGHSTQATVAWAGYSAKHQCEGFGVRFADPSWEPEFNETA